MFIERVAQLFRRSLNFWIAWRCYKHLAPDGAKACQKPERSEGNSGGEDTRNQPNLPSLTVGLLTLRPFVVNLYAMKRAVHHRTDFASYSFSTFSIPTGAQSATNEDNASGVVATVATRCALCGGARSRFIAARSSSIRTTTFCR